MKFKKYIYLFIISVLAFFLFLVLRNQNRNNYVSLNDSYCFFTRINIDSNGDGKPDTNLDIDGDGCPDVNIDAGDGLVINWDTNNDGVADTNIDNNFDLIPDKNLESENTEKNNDYYLKPEDDTTDHMNTYPEGYENKVNDMFDNLENLGIMINPSHLPLDSNDTLVSISNTIKDNLEGYGKDNIADSLIDIGLSCDLDYNCSGDDNNGKWKYSFDLNTLVFKADYYGTLNNLLSSQYIDFNTGQGIAVNYSEYYYAISNSEKMTYDVYHGAEEGVYKIDDTNDVLWQNHEAVMNKLFFSK